MKTVSLAILAVAGAVALAAPAVAQPDHHGGYGGYGGYHDRGRDDGPRAWDLNRRIDWMQQRIDRGRRDGSLDRREAGRVQARLDDIRRDKARMERRNAGFLRGDQRDQLQARLDRLNDEMHWLRNNDERRPW
ncbi:hypothetical protein ACO2Q3_21070 [Caulobacter sp. KR2-114]|uniref:hypothetical protein n=1 Tax=Caulobacter sp. KR2-114 TaxID=3400912 RepID=UPI003C0F7D23